LKRLAITWRWLRAEAIRRRALLALSVRVTAAALLALVAAELAGLPLPLWVVLTAVIVTQMSVGRSLKATGDYLMGTVGGALYGGIVAVLLPHQSEWQLLLVLAIAVAPLALFAAFRQNMNVVPITAIIVLLLPQVAQSHSGPLYSAIFRVLEVGLGAIVGLVVSFVVLPSSAHRQVRQSGARILDLMARALAALLAGLERGLDDEDLHRLQDGIGQGLSEINLLGAEAERERRARLSSEADTGPLRRTLLRLRHDLVMVGRAADAPLPPTLLNRLSPSLEAVSTEAADYLEASATALRSRTEALPLKPFEDALSAFELEVATIRREGAARPLPAEEAERFFALGFALEQLHQNLRDLRRVVDEWGPAAEADDEKRPQ
jgi:uncharacterized membrane protein YccC